MFNQTTTVTAIFVENNLIGNMEEQQMLQDNSSARTSALIKTVTKKRDEKCRLSIHSEKLLNILDSIEESTNISAAIISSSKRSKLISDARWIYFYLAQRTTDHSDNFVAQQISKDRSTMKHGIERIEKIIDTDCELDQKLKKVVQCLTLKKT